MQNFIPKNPDYQNLIAKKMEGNHFMHFIGFKPIRIQPGLFEGELEIMEHHQQQFGYLHGGVTSTLADIVAGFAAFTLVEENKAVVTAEIKIVYLNPGIGKNALCKGYVIKAGRKLIFSECEIWMENEGEQVLVAKGYGTYAVIEMKW